MQRPLELFNINSEASPLRGERGPGDLCLEPTGAVAEKKLSAKLTDEGDQGRMRV